MSIRLLVVDSDVKHGEAVLEYFNSSSSIEVVNLVSSKEEAEHYLKVTDVVLVDLLLNGMDSMNLLSKIKEVNNSIKIIATSEFITNDMMRSLNAYSINYFIKKPFNPANLESIIQGLFANSNTGGDLKVQITNMLHNLGIPSHIKGYEYLRYGVENIYNNSNLIGAITKELYPKIAEEYNTTSSRVERAIRHAIEVSWVRGDYNMMEELFGNSVDYDRSKPTNSEFIVTLADRLKIDKKYV